MFEQQSVAVHLRVMIVVHGGKTLVKVPWIEMVKLVPQQASSAVGGLKDQAVPH